MLTPQEENQVSTAITKRLEEIRNIVLAQLEHLKDEGCESSGHLFFNLSLESGQEVEVFLTSSVIPKPHVFA